MKRLLSVLSLLALAQPALAQTVVDSDFTISVPTAPGREDVVESTTLVPLLADTCYNWHLKFGKTKGDVAVTEVYTLPAPPEVWGLNDSNITVSDDQLSAISELTLTPEDGWIASGWCVSAGDPAGAYSFVIKSGETVLHTFEFELQEM